MLTAVVKPVASGMMPFQTVLPVPRKLKVLLVVFELTRFPAIVSNAPPSRLLLIIGSLSPDAAVTLALNVIAFWPLKMAVVLFAKVRGLLVVSAPSKAKMAPFEMVIPEAAPIPFVVSPRLPPAAVMLPVKVFAAAGFRIQVPPSDFCRLRIFGKEALVALTSARFIWLPSVLAPRRSKTTIRATVSPRVVFAKVPVFQTSAPEPEASTRMERFPVKLPPCSVRLRLATSP